MISASMSTYRFQIKFSRRRNIVLRQRVILKAGLTLRSESIFLDGGEGRVAGDDIEWHFKWFSFRGLI